MSEQPEEVQAPPVEQTGPVELPSDHPLVKTLEVLKAQNKELKAKASRLDEIEEAQKSELEKALARAEAAETDIAKRDAAAAAKELAEKVAAAKGVSASVLRGSTQEELEAHADSILALLPEKPKAATPGSGGNRGDDIDSEDELQDTTPGMGSLRAGYNQKG